MNQVCIVVYIRPTSLLANKFKQSQLHLQQVSKPIMARYLRRAGRWSSSFEHLLDTVNNYYRWANSTPGKESSVVSASPPTACKQKQVLADVVSPTKTPYWQKFGSGSLMVWWWKAAYANVDESIQLRCALTDPKTRLFITVAGRHGMRQQKSWDESGKKKIKQHIFAATHKWQMV